MVNKELNSKLDIKIGIIGGGQLGKMMILEAKKMGFNVSILDPVPDCPAHSICDHHIVAGFDDKEAIARLCEACHVVTYEFEHIDATALIDIDENSETCIYPSPKSLETIQNKFTQKTVLKANNIPVPDFVEVLSFDCLVEIGHRFGYPFVLKTSTGGYDGKGNFIINSPNELELAYKTLGSGSYPLMAEEFINYDMEISVIACRGINGEIAIYPVGKNTHINNILDETTVPAPISDAQLNEALNTARDVMKIFGGVGIFCVEMFALPNGKISVNEVAPRPHNSGHYTIEACVTSQFEQHIRAITGLPLGKTDLISPVSMRNILGEPGYDGRAIVQGINDALSIHGATFHFYGKKTTKPYRKMGHLTVLSSDVQVASKLSKSALSHIKIISSFS